MKTRDVYRDYGEYCTIYVSTCSLYFSNGHRGTWNYKMKHPSLTRIHLWDSHTKVILF